MITLTIHVSHPLHTFNNYAEWRSYRKTHAWPMHALAVDLMGCLPTSANADRATYPVTLYSTVLVEDTTKPKTCEICKKANES